MTDSSILSERIAEMRQRRDLTLKELADRIGVSEATMHRYEAGHTQRLMQWRIQAIADALDCSPVYLMGWSDDVHFDSYSKEEKHRTLIGKYDALDVLGRRAVDTVLDVEYERVNQLKQHKPVQYRPINLMPLPVSAGRGIMLLDEEPPEPVFVPLDDTSARADFVLEVRGDSMEPEYHDGDLILIRKADVIDKGERGIFGVNGEGYVKELGDNELISLNPDYDPIKLHPEDDVQCFGRVLGRTRRVYPDDN